MRFFRTEEVIQKEPIFREKLILTVEKHTMLGHFLTDAYCSLINLPGIDGQDFTRDNISDCRNDGFFAGCVNFDCQTGLVLDIDDPSLPGSHFSHFWTQFQNSGQ
jgi:hypothetical protein